MTLSLSQADEDGRPYQVVTARWKYIEDSAMKYVCANLNDEHNETYSLRFDYGIFDDDTGIASVSLKIADYKPSGIYQLNHLCMKDVANNIRDVYFASPNKYIILQDEPPATIDIQTKNPDFTPPVLDLNNITITAEPTRPADPNGETNVFITFKVKDDISGYHDSNILLRDPQGVVHSYWHWISNADAHRLYFRGDPTVFQTYEKVILLPAGSVSWNVGTCSNDCRR